MRKRGRKDARTVAADHQRHVPRGSRQEHRVLDAVVLALERDALTRDEPAHDLERLLEAPDAPVERNAERAELRLVPAGAQAEDEPAAGDLVDRRRHARDQAGRVERGRRHQRAELHALRRRRDCCKHGPDIPRAALGASVVAIQHVVAGPDGVEAARLRAPRDRPELRPPNVALDFRKLYANVEVREHGRRMVIGRHR